MSQIIKNLKPVWEEKASVLVDIFYRIKFTPNILTISGLLFVAIGSYFIFTLDFFIAGLFILLGNLFDALDGLLARRYGLTSKFGAFLDSVIDRLSDLIPLFAILTVYKENKILFFTTIVAIFGSFMTSYAKARAEGLSIRCDVGFFERPERSIILIGGLLTGFVELSTFILAFASSITVFQRVLWVYKNSF